MQADGWEVNGQPSVELHASLHGIDELRYVGMTRVEARVGVDDAHDGSRKRVLAVAQCLDEQFTHKQGEMRIAVRWEFLFEANTVGIDRGREMVVCVWGVLTARPFVLSYWRFVGGTVCRHDSDRLCLTLDEHADDLWYVVPVFP